MRSLTLIALCVLALYALQTLVAGAQSNVPIDSPRGSYVGAENIHWYQQKSLRVSDNEGLPPSSGTPWLCNSDNDAVDCFGSALAEPQDMYFAAGTVPVQVALVIDSRRSPEFDFPFRRGLDAIRRANDSLRRSGVNARLFVTEIEFFEFDARGYSFDALAIADRLFDEDLDFLQTLSDESRADIIVFLRNTVGQDIDVCGVATLGVGPARVFAVPYSVLTCEDSERLQFPSARLVSSHEIGHIFGLVHPEESSAAPALEFGRGHISPDTGAATIMASGRIDVPFFSSPFLLYDGEFHGVSDRAFSTQAMNQMAATVALYWEIRSGQFEFSPLSPDARRADLQLQKRPLTVDAVPTKSIER